MTREEKQKAVDALKISVPITAMTQEEFTNYIQTLNKIMDWLEQEPCEDAISRQAVLDLVVANHTELNGLNVVMYSPLYKDIKQLPPVTPKPKMGHWIYTLEDWNKYECSECGFTKRTDVHVNIGYKYCPNCGADMRGEG